MIGAVISQRQQLNAIFAGINVYKGYESKSTVSMFGLGLDSVSISAQTLMFKDQLSLFNTLTSINGKQIKDLQAKDNVLTIEAGEFYRLPINSNQSIIVSGLTSNSISVPYDDLSKELNISLESFAPEVFQTFEKMQWFLTALCNRSTWHLRTDFSRSEVLEYCNILGIKAGGWVEINNQGRINKFYLEEDGTPWPEYQIESARSGFANYDWRKSGCTEDSILVVDGKEYKMDENGHFNIPEGEPIVYNNGMVVFPKEIGEYLRKKYNWPE